MSRLKQLEPLVKTILEESELTRADDFLLVAEVYYRLIPESVNMPFGVVMMTHKKLGVPYFESIRRVRQKLQSEHSDLRPVNDVWLARHGKINEYKKYNKEKSVNQMTT